MGRWAQYRRRGRGSPLPATTPLGVEWFFENDGVDTLNANLDDPSGFPFDQWQLQWSDDGQLTWTVEGTQAPGFAWSSPGFASGEYFAQIRGCDDIGNPLTDWSSSKSTTIP